MNVNPEAILHAIFGRRSIRAYTSQPVSDESVKKLLEAAMAAPSAAGKDPWRFVVITNRDLLLRIANALPHGRMIGEAPLGIVVCGDLNEAHDRQLSYLLQDCSAAIENMLICAHAQGLGACWLGVHPREDRIKSLKDILSLQPSIIPVSCLAIGHPAEAKPSRTRFNPNYVRFES
jgi:nitroreductase